MTLSTNHPPSTTPCTWPGEMPMSGEPNGWQSCEGNSHFSGGWGPWGSSSAWTTGPWTTWWGQNGCPDATWSGWTSGAWSTDAPWTTWTGCTATTTATSTYTMTTTGGSVITATTYGVQVEEPSGTVSSVTANSNEGAAGVAVAFGSLVIALLAVIFVL
jgi:hypothetical protein